MLADFRAYSRVYAQNAELRRELQRMQGWREAALQLLHLRPHHEPAAVQDGGDAAVQLGADDRLLGLDVEQRDGAGRVGDGVHAGRM